MTEIDVAGTMALVLIPVLTFLTGFLYGRSWSRAKAKQEASKFFYNRIASVYMAARNVMYSSTIEKYQQLVDRAMDSEVTEDELTDLWKDWFERRRKDEGLMTERIRELEGQLAKERASQL